MRTLIFGVAAGLLCVAPAAAENVTFSGSLLSSCTLALSTPGTLGLSADGTIMGSDQGLGSSAAVTILSIGSNTVTVAAPTRTSAAPSGYNSTNEQVQVQYAGQAGLAGISQAYTPSQTTFPVPTIALSTLVMNNRIVNPNGFAAGNYVTQTVVTCG